MNDQIVGEFEVEGSGRWRHVWLKYITGVRLDEHCMKSFVGPGEKRVGPRMGTARVVLAPNPGGFFYLCGVDRDFVWERNAHLAFRLAPGKVAVLDWPGLKATFTNAEAIPILAKSIDPEDPRIGDPKFATCRNWQFAHWIAARRPSAVVSR